MSLALNHQKRNSLQVETPKAAFDNDTVSGNINITYFQAFLEKNRSCEILADYITYEKHHNSTFTTTDIINLDMVNATVSGRYSRFTHMDLLRMDKVFCDIMDGRSPVKRFAVTYCSFFLKGLPPKFAG